MSHYPQLAALEGMDGGIPPGNMVKGRYVLTRYQAALSRKVLSVRPGDVFLFETDVRLERMALAAEKDASPFLVGPIFYDANGEVLQWLQPRPAPAKVERIAIRAKAPWNASQGATRIVRAMGAGRDGHRLRDQFRAYSVETG